MEISVENFYADLGAFKGYIHNQFQGKVAAVSF